MTEFERTNSDFIKRKARETQERPKVGRVEQVIEHRKQAEFDGRGEVVERGDNSNFEVDVSIDDGDYDTRSIEHSLKGAGEISVPRVGDRVLLSFEDSENNKPISTDIISTVDNRPPLARAGMTRNSFQSDKSPAGFGDIYVTGFTEYDANPALENVDGLTPEKSWYQIGKHEATPDPITPEESDMLIEMYDSPKTDEAEIRLSGSQVDSDSSQGLEVMLDFKSGEVKLTAENSTGEFGIKFNSKDGTFKVADESGYGIESDGSGNFTWHYETIDHVEGSTMSF